MLSTDSTVVQKADKTQVDDDRETVDGLCGICPSGCWVEVDLNEGQIEDVRPMRDHPLGTICRRGTHSAEIVHSGNRLKYPMRRIGPKGTYEFEPISWDQAFDTIVEQLNRTKAEHGPEAATIYTGRGAFEASMCDIYQPQGVRVSSASSVLFPFGSPNTMGVGALCYVAFAMIAPHATMGEMFVDMFPDIAHAELIVVWGTNPATDSPQLDYERIKKAQKMGAEVVVIDPRRTETARGTGAEWIPLRPGTDGAFALAMINVLIEEELYDEQFVEEWTHGFDDLAAYVKRFTPERAEEITGIPGERVRKLARKVAATRGAALVMYTGLEYSNGGVQAVRACQTFWALAGQLDTLGGLNFKMKQNQFPINRDGHVANPDAENAVGRERFPLYSDLRGESHAIALPDAVLKDDPYPVRAMIIVGSSLITAWPQPEVWKKTLDGLDFLVTVDRQLTADSAYADIVLPATTYYETSSYMTYGPIFRVRERVVEPVGESRNDYFILAELARRLGYGHLYPQTEEELLEHVLKGSGFTPKEVRSAGGSVQIDPVIQQYKKWEKGMLRSDGNPGFNTPSGKFEISSQVLEKYGYESLPVYIEPAEGPLSRPDLVDKYPLVFNSGGRVQTDFRSQHHGVGGMLKDAQDPLVVINDKDAADRGIMDGDWVEVYSPRGSLEFRAKVTPDVVRGAVDANMGGGGPIGPASWQECNVNELTDLDNYDKISGFPVYKSLMCDVRPTTSSDERKQKKKRSEVVRAGVDDASVASNGGAKKGRAADERESQRTVDSASASNDVAYLDNNATTAVHEEVLDAMLPYLGSSHGNPSSIHRIGYQAHRAVEEGRRQVARLIGSTARRVIFTSGGSESDNLAIKGAALAASDKGRHIVTSAVEHPAVRESCAALENEGFEITHLQVDDQGMVDPRELEIAIRDDTILISIMHANNEVGTIQPIPVLAGIANRREIPFHTDAVQSVGKIEVDVDDLNVDLLSVSSHKMCGPKGVGALYVRKGVKLSPLIHGGGQERGIRSGTDNVPGVIGLGKACEFAQTRLDQASEMTDLRDRLERGVIEIIPEARLNGSRRERLPNTLSMTLPGIRGESLVLGMDRLGVAFSSGSACKSGHPEPSHALLAMGLSEDDAHCTVRFSLGWDTTAKDIDTALDALRQVVGGVDWDVAFVPCK